MTTMYQINLTNRSRNTESFFFFQQPASFIGGQQVYSNCLFAMPLPSYDQSGAMLSFMVRSQVYAAIQQATGSPMVGQSSGFAAAYRPIDLARPGAASNDAVTASIDPLRLSMPSNAQGVQPGAFRITTPMFQPMAPQINVGSAVETQGEIVLSSFVQGQPMMNMDCSPVPRFFVQTGNYTPGTVVNFSAATATAARCDFDGGPSTVNVSYNADGTWSVHRS